MALSKEVVLDRLNGMYCAANPETLDGRRLMETMLECQNLINSTDVAEVEKLRARVLELEAEAELHGASRPPALWAVKNTPEHTWLTKSEPFNHCGAWVSESGTSGAMDSFKSLPTLSKTPLYFGKPEIIS